MTGRAVPARNLFQLDVASVVKPGTNTICIEPFALRQARLLVLPQ